MMPKLITLVFLLWSCCSASAQEETASRMKEINAYLAESLPEAEDLSEITAGLSYFIKHPVDLNHTSPAQLNALIFLSALQISNFFGHLRTNGKLKDLLELQGIAGFDLETINRLLPYVTLRPESKYRHLRLRDIWQKADQEILLRYGRLLEQQKGFKMLPGSHYSGSPDKILARYQYNFNPLISASVLGKKDAGEDFFSGANRSGFDFLSGSLAFKQPGRFQQLVIGDYSLQFGQGLTLWSGFSLGKGPDVAGVAKRDIGLKSYTSANESSFFRGIGAKFNLLKIIHITGFISIRNLDASLNSSDSARRTLLTIGQSGLHRTASEINNKQRLGQVVYGGVLEYRKEVFNLGLIVYHSSYQHEFITGKALYRQYDFTGKELTNYGLHYQYTFRNIYFFGEAALSHPGGTALLHGAMASLSPKVSAVILYRDYAKDYVNFYSGAEGQSDGSNEKGIYAGINVTLHRHWTVSVYSDLFWFAQPKYRVDQASSGYDLMGQLNFKPSKVFKAMLRLKTKQNEQNEGSGLPVNPLAKVSKELLRLQLHWTLNRKFSLQNNAEIVRYQKGLPGSDSSAEYGYLFYQDADYSPLSSRFAANLRLAFFHTASYNSRSYAYEDDVLHGAGSGLYSGKGFRSFLNLSFRLNSRLKIWGRYAAFYYPGQDKIGTGLDQIQGNIKSDFKLQLRYQF